MTLREALANQGNSLDEIDDIMSSMIEEVENGRDPEDVLWDNANLESDYVFDLLEECL